MTLAAARHGVPYPPIVEVLIMDIALEMLAEASARLPTYIGGAAMVVGGLVLGTAAAEARLVSTVMIVVVAVTAIGSLRCLIIKTSSRGAQPSICIHSSLPFSASTAWRLLDSSYSYIFAQWMSSESLIYRHLRPGGGQPSPRTR